ncbi:MAG TPA: hypothetical protein VNY05_14255 [Candidatus Acidoferrales bacterium]|nr:hypothetical protein [Candidatus Acidoferrales bacterium]
MRITRFPSINETQFSGCVAAFVDSLAGELNAAAMALRRLQGQRKGAAFAYEMTMDTHRYGALIVLDRWSTLVGAFGPHLQLGRRPAIIGEAPQRVQAAETILSTANHVIDAADHYNDAVVEACLLAFQSVNATFAEERAEAEQSATLGPMLPDEYQAARRIFLEDLSAR